MERTTSFDVTVFSGKIGVDKDRIFISFRGTGQKTGRPDDLDSALQNASTGAAISQIVQMVNWWQRVSTTAGVDVSQFFVPTDRNEAVRINDAKATGEVYALLLAAPQAKVTVTGSSLGGHLAMAFATLFPQYTQSAVAFNAPGFGSQAGLKTLFATLGGTVPEVGNPLIANFVSREVNIATDPTDLLAGFPNDSFPGLKLTVPIENQFNTDVPDAKVPSWNHDQRQVTDALTVFDMLRRLDGSLDLTRFDYLLRASAEGENRSLENLVDTVESVLGINRAQLPAGNDRRDTLHGAVQALVGGAPQTPNPNAAFHSLAGKVVIAPTDFSLRVHARENFGAFVALQELSPFYLAGKDPAARQLLDSVLETTRSSEFATWNRDKASGFGLTFTDRWIADRQALVRALAIQNTENNTTGQIVDQRIATDRTTQFSYVGGAIPGDEAQASRHTLFAQSRPGQPSQIIFFGTDGDDVATGNGNLLGDHLYGGAGADQLDGLAGNDYLEGGSGSDSYIFSANFGHDTVVDVDGTGRDFIAAGGRLSVNLQQIGPLDTWLAPVGKQVLESGATWGVVVEGSDLTCGGRGLSNPKIVRKNRIV